MHAGDCAVATRGNLGKARGAYSDTRHHYAEFEGDPEILDEWTFTLRQVVHHQKDSFGYDYDFGDSWRHQITIEKILPPDIIGAARAICLDGARACPPEDCGGIWGYANLLKILRNRRHPEHKARKAWLGRPFFAEAFRERQGRVGFRGRNRVRGGGRG